MKKKILFSILVLSLLVFGIACSSNKNATVESSESSNIADSQSEQSKTKKEVINQEDPIIVSTQNDIESEILGRMMCLVLENAGYKVTDNSFGYTGTVNGRNALLAGETDIHLEYTGRGLRLIEGVDPMLYREMESAWESISTWDKENNDLIWLRYAPFNNTDALAVTKEFSETNGVKTVDELAKYINDGKETKLIAWDYWVTMPSGLPGFEEAYGFKLNKDQYIVSGDYTEQALYEGVDGVNVAHLFSSSALVLAYDFVVLEDTKHISPVFSPAPIMRKEKYEQYPEIAPILNNIFESLTLDEMVNMKKKVQVDGYSGKEVAKEYLLSKGLISE